MSDYTVSRTGASIEPRQIRRTLVGVKDAACFMSETTADRHD